MKAQRPTTPRRKMAKPQLWAMSPVASGMLVILNREQRSLSLKKKQSSDDMSQQSIPLILWHNTVQVKFL
jgi:hypothetical protein